MERILCLQHHLRDKDGGPGARRGHGVRPCFSRLGHIAFDEHAVVAGPATGRVLDVEWRLRTIRWRRH